MRNILKKARNMMALLMIIWKWLVASSDDTNKETAFIFGISKWKQEYIKHFLKEYEVVYFVPTAKISLLLTIIKKRFKNLSFITWGIYYEQELSAYARHHHIPFHQLEDGFVRSVGLGAMHTPPFSICLDRTGIYFDSSKPSDLEEILNTYDFDSNPSILDRAKKCMDALIKLGISKYNHIGEKDIEHIYGPKTKRRILVIGQVEDDASIKRGSNKQWTNYDLVHIAYKENPDAEIIYKPHPDVLTGKRPSRSNIEDAKKISKVIEEPLSLVDSFKTIDHVYTITSLSGFEALIRGIRVTTMGAPFYSGWGLTDDRQPVDRRKRKLSIIELFAGAYLLYPRYMDPETKVFITLEETIQKLQKQIKD